MRRMAVIFAAEIAANAKYAKLVKCSSDTALRDIDDLLRKNVLVKDQAGGRSTSYSLRDADPLL